MVGHYRRQTSRRTTARRGRASPSWGWIWLLSGLFLGILSAAVAYQAFNKNPSISLKTAKNNDSASSQKTKLSKETSQKFEFYTLLPGMEVQVQNIAPSKSATQQTLKTPPAPINKTPISKPLTNSAHLKKTTRDHYIIQAGLFRTYQEADNLKARLTLHGFNTQIQLLRNPKGITRFRVALGPFESSSAALIQQKRLTTHKIQGVLILQRNKL